MSPSTAFRTAAVFGFLAVALGAFGAHGLRDVLARNGTTDYWTKATLYHLVHSAVLLFLASRTPFPRAAWIAFAIGIVCFSGSLYVLALGGPKPLVYATPLGGLCLLAGWLLLVFPSEA